MFILAIKICVEIATTALHVHHTSSYRFSLSLYTFSNIYSVLLLLFLNWKRWRRIAFDSEMQLNILAQQRSPINQSSFAWNSKWTSKPTRLISRKAKKESWKGKCKTDWARKKWKTLKSLLRHKIAGEYHQYSVLSLFIKHFANIWNEYRKILLHAFSHVDTVFSHSQLMCRLVRLLCSFCFSEEQNRERK